MNSRAVFFIIAAFAAMVVATSFIAGRMTVQPAKATESQVAMAVQSGVKKSSSLVQSQAVAMPQPAVVTKKSAYDPQQFADELRATLLLGGPRSRAEMLALVQRIGAENMKSALEMARQILPPAAYGLMSQALIQRWADLDPAAAGDYVLSLPADESRDSLLSILGHEMAASNPAAAAKLALNVTDDSMRFKMLDEFSQRWAYANPQAAGDFGLTLPEGQNRSVVLKHIAWAWATKDPHAALDWAAKLPTSEDRSGAISAAVGIWAMSSPNEAYQYAMTLSPEDQTRTIRSMVNGMAHKDPVATANWVEQFPEGNTRDRATERLVKSWAERDLTAAGDWLNRQPESSGKQQAIRDMVDASAPGSPQAAWDWALKLTDPVDQVPALTALAKTWMGNNPDQAKKIIQASSLSDSLKAKLLQTY